MLDDTQKEDDGSADIHGHGFLDQARWAWLKKELADGDAAGQLMIIAAHVPINVEVTAPNSEMGWWLNPENAVTLPNLIAELQSHPNLIMWISGHRHLNTVKAFIRLIRSMRLKKAFGRLKRRRSGISRSSSGLLRSTSTATIPFPS